jgi:hypothetical protein
MINWKVIKMIYLKRILLFMRKMKNLRFLEMKYFYIFGEINMKVWMEIFIENGGHFKMTKEKNLKKNKI